MSPSLYLASRSPRRSQLLDQIRIRHQTMPVDIDETPRNGEQPSNYVRRMAEEKALAGLQRLGGHNGSAPACVLGADTAVVLDEHILGKPVDRTHAASMLRRLSGRSHQVISAVCVATPQRHDSRIQVSTVYFRTLADDEIAAYCRTDEPLDKAGAYAIQGLGALFVQRLEGSYSGVMGLPLLETWQLLKENACC